LDINRSVLELPGLDGSGDFIEVELLLDSVSNGCSENKVSSSNDFNGSS
jgi:hypothetical protein